MKIDLHTHTTASDGTLPPLALLERAQSEAVDVLAITDHDAVRGVAEALTLQEKGESSYQGRLVPGVELTVLWQNTVLHLLGLSIDPQHAALQRLIDQQHKARHERGMAIVDALAKAGFSGMEKALEELPLHSVITRPHIARFLVASGQVKSEAVAFKRWLGRGKAGDVPCIWVGLAEAIGTIQAAGGIAVLAHPDKYRLSTTKLGLLAADFAEMGGDGVELVCGSQAIANQQYWQRLLAKYQLFASCGSDFHDPAQCWREVGRVAALPNSVSPVWEHERFSH